MGAIIAFTAFSTIAVVAALMVIFKRDAVASAFSLVLVLFSFAGIYALLGAHFVAALQILVYTGAIMVLFVFVIMLLNSEEPENDLKKSGWVFRSVVLGSLMTLGTVLILSLKDLDSTTPSGNLTDAAIQSGGGNLRMISETLFTRYVLHFELSSFLVLGAIVATVALHKRKRTEVLKDGVSL